MLRVTRLSLHRGHHPLFADFNLALNTGWKCGVTGANGTGKSSLFALLRGVLTPDAGTVSVPPGWTIAQVAQESSASDRPAIEHVLDGDSELRSIESSLGAAENTGDGLLAATLHARLDAIDAWSARARAARLLNGLGFAPDDESRPVAHFSGGWRMRLNLAQALMCRSDLLLLDEPTNHLDLDAVLWLEDWLQQYRGTLLLISHDRDFLDRTVDHILHLERRGERTDPQLYSGNYSDFERQRAAQRARQQADYAKQQRTAAHLRAFVDRFRAKASKSRQAQSRLKQLERMPDLLPAHEDSPFHFAFRDPEKLPTPLLTLDRAAAGYGPRTLLADLNLELAPGDRVGLLGPNGAGKTTLVRLLAGELPPLAGERVAARDLNIGYFAQHQLEQLRPTDSPLQHLARLDPAAREQDLREYLGGFGFTGERALAPVAPFSGGEKARLALALVVYSRPNLLLLDEPTNHLDLEMRHALTLALQDYTGALVVVSHDRYLLASVTDALLRVADGHVEPFDGDLDDYAQWLTRRRARDPSGTTTETARTAPSRRDQRRLDAERRRQQQPLKSRLQSLETDLVRLGAEQSRLAALLAEPALYTPAEKPRLKNLLQEQGRVQQALTQAEAAWLQASEALELANQGHSDSGGN